MAGGLEEDFDAFYAATQRRIVSHIYVMTGSLREAEDCVQEAYARAWQQWGKLSADVDSPESWVRTVAARLAGSSWRRAVNRLRGHRREREAGEVVGLSSDHIAVVAALRKVSPDQRMAIVLYHYAGLSVDEIAAETGVPPGTVKARLSRGRRALAPHLPAFMDNGDYAGNAESPDRRRTRPPQFSSRPQPSGRGI